jgi:hypothetical protein
VLRDGGAADAARPHLERAVESLVPGEYRVESDLKKAALALAQDLRRAGRPVEALAVLDRLAAAAPGDPDPVLEAAKLLEHDLKDGRGARERAVELRARWLLKSGGARRAKGLEDAARRIARLGG